MTNTCTTGCPTQNIIDRVKNIILNPKQEWEKIATEPTTTKDLFVGYAVILAAIPSVCGLIGSVLFGKGFTLLPSLISYVLSLLSVAVFAYVIDALAPTFGGEKNIVQANKVAIYSSTPNWVAGIFTLLPRLVILGLLGLYSVYLLYIGLPKLMKAPPEKAMGYTVTVIVIGIVLFMIVGAIAGTALLGSAAMM